MEFAGRASHDYPFAHPGLNPRPDPLAGGRGHEGCWPSPRGRSVGSSSGGCRGGSSRSGLVDLVALLDRCLKARLAGSAPARRGTRRCGLVRVMMWSNIARSGRSSIFSIASRQAPVLCFGDTSRAASPRRRLPETKTPCPLQRGGRSSARDRGAPAAPYIPGAAGGAAASRCAAHGTPCWCRPRSLTTQGRAPRQACVGHLFGCTPPNPQCPQTDGGRWSAAHRGRHLVAPGQVNKSSASQVALRQIEGALSLGMNAGMQDSRFRVGVRVDLPD